VLCLQGHARAKRSVRRLEEEGGDTEESQN